MVKKPADIYWEGQSGKKYGYWIVSIHATFKDVPGNYIYAKETKHYTWKPVHISHTRNLAFRLLYKDTQRDRALKNGATHIHCHSKHHDKKTRMAEATDLINKWNPFCNA